MGKTSCKLTDKNTKYEKVIFVSYLQCKYPFLFVVFSSVGLCKIFPIEFLEFDFVGHTTFFRLNIEFFGVGQSNTTNLFLFSVSVGTPIYLHINNVQCQANVNRSANQ